MDERLLDALAVRVLEVWLIQQGFQLSGGWDENDPNCRRQYGPHVLWTVQARIPGDYDYDTLLNSFRAYIAKHNALPSAVKFEPYDITIYECPCGCGVFLFASIYQ